MHACKPNMHRHTSTANVYLTNSISDSIYTLKIAQLARKEIRGNQTRCQE